MGEARRKLISPCPLCFIKLVAIKSTFSFFLLKSDHFFFFASVAESIIPLFTTTT